MNQVRSFESLGAPLFESRSSQIYTWEGSVLLKLFREEIDQELIDNEEINTIEAYEKGVSRIKCYGQVRVENRSGIIMERIEGKTLISLVPSMPGIVFRCSQIMVDLQTALHNTPGDKIRSYKDLVRQSLDSPPLGFLTQEEKLIAEKKINALPDGNYILHLDYHPDNIMSDGKSASIIDWMTAATGTPAADVAATLYLLNEGEMIPGLSKLMAAIMQIIRKAICKSYYKKYKAATGMTDEQVALWRLPFLIVRLGVWNIASEADVLQEKIRSALKE